MVNESGKQFLLYALGLGDAVRRDDTSAAVRYRGRTDNPLHDVLAKLLHTSGLWVMASTLERNKAKQQMLEVIEHVIGLFRSRHRSSRLSRPCKSSAAVTGMGGKVARKRRRDSAVRLPGSAGERCRARSACGLSIQVEPQERGHRQACRRRARCHRPGVGRWLDATGEIFGDAPTVAKCARC
jgi:hypothetical protein